MSHRTWVWVGLSIALLGSAAALAAQPTTTPADYTRRILDLINRGEYRQAIGLTGEYELNLLARYEPPMYERGRFRSEMQHVSFQVPWSDWKRIAISDSEACKGVLTAGYEFLLLLSGDNDSSELMILSKNWPRMVKKLGMGTGTEKLTDDVLEQAATIFGGHFGIVRSQKFQKLAGRTVLYQELAAAPGRAPGWAIYLREEDRIFVFQLTTSVPDTKEREQKLQELVGTVRFDYKPEKKDVVNSIQAEHVGNDLKSLLGVVEKLAGAGEYDKAIDQLVNVRLSIAAARPQCRARNNIAFSPGYGMTLTNPDPATWTLGASSEGTTDIILLENRTTPTEAIAVVSLDFQLAYGPELVKLITGDLQARKNFLANAGRGAGTMSGDILSERSVTLKNSMAYEVLVSMRKVPGVKGRIQVILKGDYAVIVTVLADEKQFNAKLSQADEIMATNLKIE